MVKLIRPLLEFALEHIRKTCSKDLPSTKKARDKIVRTVSAH
jgi:hypothetical protein